MAESQERPTAEYIERCVQVAEARDAKRNEKFDRIEQLRFRQHEVPIPKAYQKMTNQKIIKIPLVDDTLRTVISDIAASFPTASVPPRKFSQQANSSLREKWFNAAMPRMDAADGLDRAYVREIDHACTFGLACPKWLYLPHAWDNKQLRRKKGEDETKYLVRAEDYKTTAPLPFTWLVPDPRTCHFWTHNRVLDRSLEITMRTREDLAEDYRDRGVDYDVNDGRLRTAKFSEPRAESAIGFGGEIGQQVPTYEFWNNDWVTYMADGIVLDSFKHKYGRPAHMPYHGLSSSSTAPEFESQSIVENLLDMVEVIDIALNAALQWGYITAMPMGVVRQPQGMPGASTEANVEEGVEQEVATAYPSLTYSPGEMIVAPPGVEFGWVVGPEGGRDLKELGDKLIEIAKSMSGVPDIMRGIMPNREVPAWGLMQLYQAARRVYNPVTTNCAISLTKRAELMYHIIENVHKDIVYVQVSERDKRTGKVKKDWLGLGPRDIDGYHAINIDIETLTMDRRIQQGQYGLQLWNSGAITQEELLEHYLMYSSPEEMQRRLRIEKFRNSPPYNQYVMDRWFARQDLRVQQRRQEAGLVPPPTQPAVNEGQQPAPAGPENITGAPAAMAPGPGQGGVGLIPPNSVGPMPV